MTHSPWHELLELIAAAVLTIGGAIALGLAWRRRNVPPPAETPLDAVDVGPRRLLSPWLALVAALSVGAGAIHLAATPSHLEELGVAGLGFLGVGIFQLAWPMGYRFAARRPVAAVGIVVNLAVLGAWAWSRTAGLPFGPSAGIPEAIGTADAAASAFEVVLVALLVPQLATSRMAWRPLRRVTSAALVAVVPAVGIVFLTSTLAVSVALAGHSHAPDQVHAEGAGTHGGADHAPGTGTDHHASDDDAGDDHHAPVAPSPDAEDEASPPARPRPQPSTGREASPTPASTPTASSLPTDSPAHDDGDAHGHGEGEDEPHAHP
jgi:hypothetical protein